MRQFLVILAVICLTATLTFAESLDENGAPLNTLSNAEKLSGWKLLWDGKSTEGWHGARLDHFPKVGWSMEDGILSVHESGGGEAEHGGDIVTDDLYGSFELSVEFKITPGANSGIKYFVFPKTPNSKGSAIGLEFQVLDISTITSPTLLSSLSGSGDINGVAYNIAYDRVFAAAETNASEFLVFMPQ